MEEGFNSKMTVGAFVTIRYQCSLCKSGWREVIVRARREDEDVVAWVETVALVGVGHDHNSRSPECSSLQVDLMVPAPKDKYIGAPQTVN